MQQAAGAWDGRWPAEQLQAPAQPIYRVAVTVVAVATLLLRLVPGRMDPMGDEAWYFFLSQTLGAEPAPTHAVVWSHLVYRPLTYLLFHPATFGGLLWFRWVQGIFGALVVYLSGRLARQLGASRWAALVAAGVVCVHPVQIFHSHVMVPDMVATFFALAATLAALRGQCLAATATAVAAVLCKESFLAVGPALWLWLAHAETGRWRWPQRRWWWLFLPVAVVSVMMVVAMGLLGGGMQGWSAGRFDLQTTRDMLVGPEVWPLAWLLWKHRRLRELYLWLVLPLFYLLFYYGLGRGVCKWYSIGPACYAAAAMGVALDYVPWRWVAQRWRVAAAASGLALVVAAGHDLVAGKGMRWPGGRNGPHLARKYRGLYGVSTTPAVRRVLEEHGAQNVLAANCFWAFVWWPFKPAGAHGEAILSDGTEVCAGDSPWRRADYAVLCFSHGTLKPEVAAALEHCRIFDNADYWVVSHPWNCIREAQVCAAPQG